MEPSAIFHATSNDLDVIVRTTNITISNPSKTCTIRNIPIQKWIHLVVSIHGRVIDLYLNGKLVRSCLSADVPNISGLSSTSNVKVAPTIPKTDGTGNPDAGTNNYTGNSAAASSSIISGTTTTNNTTTTKISNLFQFISQNPNPT